jgi:DNA-directed RNA polymerase subunit RPC12/RpoP
MTLCGECRKQYERERREKDGEYCGGKILALA